MKYDQVKEALKEVDYNCYLVTGACWNDMMNTLYSKAQNAKYAVEADAYLDCIRVINSHILDIKKGETHETNK